MDNALVGLYQVFLGFVLGLGPYGVSFAYIYNVLTWVWIFAPVVFIGWFVWEKFRSIQARENVVSYWATRTLWFLFFLLLLLPVRGWVFSDLIHSDPVLSYMGVQALNSRTPLINWVTYGFVRAGLRLAGRLTEGVPGVVAREAVSVCGPNGGDIAAALSYDFQTVFGWRDNQKYFTDPQRFQENAGAWGDYYKTDLADFCDLAMNLDYSRTAPELSVFTVPAYLSALRESNDRKRDFLQGMATWVISILEKTDPRMAAGCRDLARMGAFENCFSPTTYEKLTQLKRSDPVRALAEANKIEESDDGPFWARMWKWGMTKVDRAMDAAAEKVHRVWQKGKQVARAGLDLIGLRDGILRLDSVFLYAISVSYIGFFIMYFVSLMGFLARVYLILLFRFPFSENRKAEIMQIAYSVLANFLTPSFAVVGLWTCFVLRGVVVRYVAPMVAHTLKSGTFVGLVAGPISGIIISLTSIILFTAIIFSFGFLLKRALIRGEIEGKEAPELRPSIPHLERYGIS